MSLTGVPKEIRVPAPKPPRVARPDAEPAPARKEVGR